MTEDTRTEAVELLPCPFNCGGDRAFEDDNEDFHIVRVFCCRCGCAGPYVNMSGDIERDKADAARLWNTRAAIAAMPVDPRIEQGREALDECAKQLVRCAEGFRRFDMRTYVEMAESASNEARTVYQAMGGGEK